MEKWKRILFMARLPKSYSSRRIPRVGAGRCSGKVANEEKKGRFGGRREPQLSNFFDFYNELAM